MKNKKEKAADDKRVPLAENVREYEARRFIGKRTHIITKQGSTQERQRAFLESLESDGTMDYLKSIAKAGADYAAGICTNFTSKGYDYWIAVEVDEDTPVNPVAEEGVPAEYGYEETNAAQGKYAYFECEIDGIKDCWADIYNRWFPKSGYNHTGAQEIEIFPFGNRLAEDYRCTLLVPVRAIERIPLSKYKRGGMLGAAPFILLGSIAGALISGAADTKTLLVSALLGGTLTWFLFEYISRRLDQRDKRRAAEAEAAKAECAANEAIAELDKPSEAEFERQDDNNER